MRAAVVTFPGSNCDRDMRVAIEKVSGRAPLAVWHRESELPEVDFIALPGGFSYGDYLRCGAIAARSEILPAVIRAARRGVPVLGVCNGFQILTECGLLPGALMRNAGLAFICREVELRVETTQSVFTRGFAGSETVRMPIAHHDGNYVCDAETLARLRGEDRVAFRYLDTPNGATDGIAGVLGEARNVLGMMPHPERMIEPLQGGSDGRRLFESVLGVLEAA